MELSNWLPYVITLVVIGGYLIFLAYQKPKKIKEWLIDACCQAEEYFGQGAGQLKLRRVYSMFVEQFPILANFVSFDRFVKWVDESLDVFQHWVETDAGAARFFELNDDEEDDDNEE